MENYHAPKSKVHPMWKTRKRQGAKRAGKKKYYAKCQTRWKELSGPNTQCGSGIISIINYKRLRALP